MAEKQTTAVKRKQNQRESTTNNKSEVYDEQSTRSAVCQRTSRREKTKRFFYMSAPVNNTSGTCQLRSGRILNPEGATSETSVQSSPTAASGQSAQATPSTAQSPTAQPCSAVDRRSPSRDRDPVVQPGSIVRTLPTINPQPLSDESDRESPLFFYTDNMAAGSNTLLPSPFHGKPGGY